MIRYTYTYLNLYMSTPVHMALLEALASGDADQVRARSRVNPSNMSFG